MILIKCNHVLKMSLDPWNAQGVVPPARRLPEAAMRLLIGTRRVHYRLWCALEQNTTFEDTVVAIRSLELKMPPEGVKL